MHHIINLDQRTLEHTIFIIILAERTILYLEILDNLFVLLYILWLPFIMKII